MLKNNVHCDYPLCEIRSHPTNECPVITQSCPTCHHRGHDEGDHAHQDQIILDRLYLLFAPTHFETGEIWMKDKVTEDDWCRSYTRMEWTPKAGAITELPKPIPDPLSVILKRQAEAERLQAETRFAEKIALAKALETQEAIVEAIEPERQNLEKQIKEAAKETVSTNQMDVDNDSKIVAVLNEDEEAELLQLEQEKLERDNAKRVRLERLREEAAAAKRDEAKQTKAALQQETAARQQEKRERVKAKAEMNAQAKAISQKIEAEKVKKDLETRSGFAVLPTEKACKSKKLGKIVQTFFQRAEEIAAQTTLMDTTPRALSALGIDPEVLEPLPTAGLPSSARIRPYVASVTPGSENNPIGLDETQIPEEDDELMNDA